MLLVQTRKNTSMKLRPCVLTFTATMLLLLPLLVAPGCSTTTIPIGRMEIPVPDLPMMPNNERDFRGLSWSGALNAAIIQMQKEYAFGDWKDINWDRLRARYSDRISEAEETRNDWAYYMALRDFTAEFQDGLVDLPAELGYKRRDLGGGYGISLLPLLNEEILVTSVDTGRHSLANSIQPGARILEWNNTSTWTALQDTSIVWTQPPPATEYGINIAHAEMLARAPIGSTTTIQYQNPGRGDNLNLDLTATLDEGDHQRGTITDGAGIFDFASPFDSKMVNNYGYIKVNFLSSTMAMPFPARAFQNHLQRLMDRNMQGLIIDLRGNNGGDSALPLKLLGHFVEFETVYRDLAYRDAHSDTFAIRFNERMSISPQTSLYKGPIVVLVGFKTFGAAESMAYALRQLPRSRVVGFSASHGTADVPTQEVILPGSYRITYPIARAVTPEGKVIITANKDGIGGVQPDVLVPLNRTNATAFYVEGNDVVLREAIRLLQQGF